jgi:hypothetical protein
MKGKPREGRKELSVGSISEWPVGKGASWLQTRDARLARKLGRRSDTRLVAIGVSGGYLRIFEMRRPPSFVRRLTARYVVTNERVRELEARSNARKGAAG